MTHPPVTFKVRVTMRKGSKTAPKVVEVVVPRLANEQSMWTTAMQQAARLIPGAYEYEVLT